MEVIYSFKDSFSTTFSIAILTNLLPIVITLIVLFSQIKKEFSSKKFIIFVLIIVVMISFANFYIEVTQLYGLYKTEYKRVEGYIEQLTLHGENYNRYDSFVVDGVALVIYPNNRIGYNKCKKDGGAITNNGQKVTIEYVFYEGKKENVIMKLEVENQS